MRRRQTNEVLDDVRFTSTARPLAINIPPENSLRRRLPSPIPQHTCPKESPTRPQVPSQRGYSHEYLTVPFFPGGIADPQSRVLCQ